MKKVERREGMNLVEYVNKSRPKTAPKVEGLPCLHEEGVGWTVKGWRVRVEIDEASGVTVHWQAPAGSRCIGYSLTGDGKREHAVDVAGDGDWRPGWPTKAAA